MAVKKNIDQEQDVVDRAKKVLQNISKKETNRDLTTKRLGLVIEEVELKKEALRLTKIGLAKTKDILDKVRDSSSYDAGCIAEFEQLFSTIEEGVATWEVGVSTSKQSLESLVISTESKKGAGKIGTMLPKGKDMNKRLSLIIDFQELLNDKIREKVGEIIDVNNSLTNFASQVGVKAAASDKTTEKS